jgi:glycosyltransferase involved in cell wall biosynthesis
VENILINFGTKYTINFAYVLSQAIEQSLEKLIVNRPYLEQLRRNAHATAQRYSWNRIARDTLSLYEETLKRKKAIEG